MTIYRIFTGIMLAGALLLAACGELQTECPSASQRPVEVTEVSVDMTEVWLTEGESVTLPSSSPGPANYPPPAPSRSRPRNKLKPPLEKILRNEGWAPQDCRQCPKKGDIDVIFALICCQCPCYRDIDDSWVRSDRGIAVVAARWRRKPVADAGIIDKYIIKDQLEAAEGAWPGRRPTMH